MSNNDRVTIIAVGVGSYIHMKKLMGPIEDVKKLRELLVENHDTAIYGEERFIELINPDAAKLREAIIEYTMSRSARNDILIFYFSGHGIPIGNFDMGLCTIDTQIHPMFEIPIPLNLIRFRDIVESLAAVHVDPVIIIDACFSAQAGQMIQIVYSELKRIIQADTGSTYALLCSSAKNEGTPDQPSGGPFSEILINVARKGLGDNHKRKAELGSTIHTTYSKLSYQPVWGLIEKIGGNKRSKECKLTERGCAFMKGEIEIPYTIQKCSNNEEYWTQAPSTKMVKFKDL